MFKELLAAGVYTVPGSACHCGAVGWLRLVVSVSADELMKGE